LRGVAASDLELSCLVAGNHSTIRNVTVCQGSPPTPLPAGTSGVHRNGIMIVADHEATVEWVRVVNARRGAVMTALDEHTTRGAIRHTLVEGTELAGMFVWAVRPTGQGTNDATLSAELAQDRIVRAGLHPFITAWSYNGNRNVVNVSYIDDVVEAATPEAPAVKGIAIVGEGEGHRNRVSFEVRGGTLAGGWGVVVEAFGNNGSNNVIQGVVSGVTITNAVPALGVFFPGPGNEISIGYHDNRYLGATPGAVQVYIDKNSELDVAGSAQDFAASNQNFDATALVPYFSQ
jgi:hypothetical protein